MDNNQPEAVKSLRRAGFLTRPDLTIDPRRLSNAPDRAAVEPGRPDCVATSNGRGVLIEFKDGDRDFNTQKWTIQQRVYPEKYAIPNGTDVYYWLTLGDEDPRAQLDKPFRRRSWFVPFYPWQRIINLVESVQNTLPYRVTKHHAIAMRANDQHGNLDAVSLLKDYELVWSGGGIWEIPSGHIFSTIYIENPLDLIVRQ